MAISTESFLDILEAARKGELQLPEFQRDYIWKRRQVIDLFDSLRQKYPIGALLFMERNPDVAIVPRPFEGTASEIEAGVEPEAFVLDGQQRITSGLALYYGLSSSHYFLDLNQLWKLAKDKDLDLSKDREITAFLEDLDPDDAYCVGRLRSSDPLKLLDRHLLYTGVLHDSTATRDALRRYSSKFPERADFADIVVRDNFRLAGDVYVPVTKVEKSRPVEAVSRIFATLNTTGQPLNSFELVVAILYPNGIRLRSDIQDNRELYSHYNNMDRTGEVFLQTVAMLSSQSPKKAQLPKTITPLRYRQFRVTAVEILEDLGVFLTQRLGIGLDQSALLVPYDSIFAPMSLALAHLKGMNLAGADRAKAERKLEKWFVVSALSKRYQEGVHNKQSKDLGDCIAWLESDDAEPQWIAEFRVPRLSLDTPDGAVGRLLRCLINLRKPTDPVTGQEVGERLGAVVSSKHHIFPTRWIDKFLDGWDSKRDLSDLALNVTMVSQETNVRWSNVDPASQVKEMEDAAASPASLRTVLAAHFIDDGCVAILKRSDKSKADFLEFVQARERAFLRVLDERWGIAAAIGEVSEEELDARLEEVRTTYPA